MKQFFALALALACLSAHSQSGLMPYNPDADGDQLVDMGDLISVLSLFGLEWNPDSIHVYGFTELEEPSWCELHPNNCTDQNRWRQVPEDADVIYWDWPTNYMWSTKLALPDSPRTLVIFGVSPTENGGFGTYNYMSENGSTSGNAVQYFGKHENTQNLAILTGFDGRWWQLRN